MEQEAIHRIGLDQLQGILEGRNPSVGCTLQGD